jgi:oligopeptide transport system substrate-binding protein
MIQKRRTRRTGLALLAAPMAVLLIALGCTSKRQEERRQNVLRVLHADDIKTLDPAHAYDSLSLEVVLSVLEPLYQFDYLSEPLRIVPLLAADYPKFSEDQRTVTIPIRTGIHYADDPEVFKNSGGKGREVTAEDFVYAIRRLMDPEVHSEGSWIFDQRLESVRARDRRTLELRLLKPMPRLIPLLTLAFTAPVPREAMENAGPGALAHRIVGTGPFRLASWKRGVEIVLEKNPRYRSDFYPTMAPPALREAGLLTEAGKPLPFVDQVRIQIEKEQVPRWKAFENGKVDLIQVPKENLARLLNDRDHPSEKALHRGWKILRKPESSFFYIAFNLKDPLLGSNRLLRQALSSAIDRDAWIRAFTTGRARKMRTAVPSAAIDAPPEGKLQFDFDPARARTLLAKAGFPNGQGLPPLTLDLRGNDTEARALGEMFHSQFAAIGVAVQPVYNTLPAFLEKAAQGKLQLSLGGWTLDYPDVENVYQLLYGPNRSPGPNETHFDSSEFNRLYEQLVRLPSGPTRSALAGRLDRILQEECPWALGIHAAEYEASQPWVRPWRSVGVIPSRFKFIAIDLERRKTQAAAEVR